MTEYDTTHEATGGVLTVRAATKQRFRDLDGEERTVREVVETISIDADEDLALAIAHELEAYYAGEQGTGPPEGKPIHQRIAEAEPDG